MPKIVICDTFEKQLKGVMGHKEFPKDTIYIFPNVHSGSMFHMATVPFPLDIAFLDKNNKILDVVTMVAEYGKAKAPPKTAKAVEAPVGYFSKYFDVIPSKELDDAQ